MSELWALTASAAQVDATERAAIASEMESWIANGGEGIALVTCHRAELYGAGRAPDVAQVQALEGEAAIAHLLRVACGLESVIVGEDEVLHQVRDALAAARQRTLDPRLHRLFETAIAAGRRARSGRTAQGGNLAQSAIAWLHGKVSLTGRTVVVAGAGRMGAALAHSATGAGAEVVVASRDVERAGRLAARYAGRGVDLQAGAELAADAAGVAVALGGPWVELTANETVELPPIVDLSAPQSVPDAVRRRMNGGFFGIDDLYRRGGPLPGAYTEHADRQVAKSTSEYASWLAARK